MLQIVTAGSQNLLSSFTPVVFLFFLNCFCYPYFKELLFFSFVSQLMFRFVFRFSSTVSLLQHRVEKTQQAKTAFFKKNLGFLVGIRLYNTYTTFLKFVLPNLAIFCQFRPRKWLKIWNFREILGLFWEIFADFFKKIAKNWIFLEKNF